MGRELVMALIVFVVLALAIGFTPTAEENVDTAMDAVVSVYATDGVRRSVSTGFVVAPGYVATVAHGIAPLVRIESRSGETVPVEGPVHHDSERDLALIEADTSGLPRLHVACRRPELGEEVVAIGHPGGIGWAAFWGRVASARSPDGSPISLFRDALVVDVGINSGMSGGPLLDDDGLKVVGVVKGTSIYSTGAGRGQGHAGLAADGNALCDLLREVGVPGYGLEEMGP